MVHRMKDDWMMVRAAFKKEQDIAAAYVDRRRTDYQFKEGQDVLINRRRHYRGQFGSDRWPLAPRAVGPFRVKRVLTPCTLEKEIPLAVRGLAVPVFHSSDLIPYETMVLDPEGMLPEVPGGDGGGGDWSGPVRGPRGGGRGSGKRWKRRSRGEEPG